MVWVARRQTYAGSSLLGLDEREATAFHTIVLLRCLYWPIPPYTNKEYNPDKGVYGRLTELRRSIEYETVPPLGSEGSPLFVEKDRLIHFPDNVIYDEFIPLARIQRLYGEGMLKLLDELDDPDIPSLAPVPKKKALLKLAYWIATALDVDDDATLEGEYAIPGHGNRKWALSTHPEAVWEWTVLAFLSDFLSSTEEEDDPGGEDPDAPDPPTDAPPSELPPGGIDTDEPPVGTPPGWFDPPPGEPEEPEEPPLFGEGETGGQILFSFQRLRAGVVVGSGAAGKAFEWDEGLSNFRVELVGTRITFLVNVDGVSQTVWEIDSINADTARFFNITVQYVPSGIIESIPELSGP